MPTHSNVIATSPVLSRNRIRYRSGPGRAYKWRRVHKSRIKISFNICGHASQEYPHQICLQLFAFVDRLPSHANIAGRTSETHNIALLAHPLRNWVGMSWTAQCKPALSARWGHASRQRLLQIAIMNLQNMHPMTIRDKGPTGTLVLCHSLHRVFPVCRVMSNREGIDTNHTPTALVKILRQRQCKRMVAKGDGKMMPKLS